MKVLINIILFFCAINCFSQIEYIPNRYYKQPGENIKQCIDVEYFDNQFQTFEKGKICRESIWIKKYHQGNVWVPVYTDGTWKPIRNQEGYFWFFSWDDWKFEKIP